MRALSINGQPWTCTVHTVPGVASFQLPIKPPRQYNGSTRDGDAHVKGARVEFGVRTLPTVYGVA
jgi:hypothetical protein